MEDGKYNINMLASYKNDNESFLISQKIYEKQIIPKRHYFQLLSFGRKFSHFQLINSFQISDSVKEENKTNNKVQSLFFFSIS